MDDVGVASNRGYRKCAKICGDTSGNYHPHGESVIYPTLVRMAQEWSMRRIAAGKESNFGSIPGLPPDNILCTQALRDPVRDVIMAGAKLDTVDFIPTYD